MTQLASRLSRFVPRRRVAILATILALGSAALLMLPRVEGEFSPQALFASTPDEEAFANELIAQFGSAENALLVVITADDVFRPDVLDWIRRVTGELEPLPYIERVQSVTNAPLPRSDGAGTLELTPIVGAVPPGRSESEQLRHLAQSSRMASGTLVSSTGRMAVVAASIDRRERQVAEITPHVQEMRALVRAVEAPPGAEVFFAGLPHIRVHVVSRLIGDQFVLIPLAAITNLFFLLFAFRWLPGVFLPLIAVGMSMTMLVGGMAAVGEPFNIINNVLPTLIIVIGISDSIHLLNRYREEIGAGQPPDRAIRTTIRTMAVACFFTSLTTAIGFGSLLVSSTEILQRFGLTAAIGVLVAYAITIFFLPSALTLFRPPRHLPEPGRDGLFESIAVSAHRLVMKRPVLILAVSGVVLAAAIASSFRVVVDSSLLELFDRDDPIFIQTKMMEDEMGGVLSFDIALISGPGDSFEDPDLLGRAEELATWLKGHEGILGVRQWTDPLRDLRAAYGGDPEHGELPFTSRQQIAQLAFLMADSNNDPSDPWVNADRSMLRMNVRSADRGGRAMIDASERIRDEFESRFEGTNVTVRLAGDSYLASLGLDLLIRDLISSIVTAFLFIFAVLVLLFRSVRLGVLAFPPNIIPLVLTLGYMGARGIPLNSTTLIIFSVSLGLAVDNTIHVISRYLEERRAGRRRDDALEAVARGTGRAVLVSSILLLCGLGVVVFSSFVPIRLFAELTALTILSCVVADLLILPALLHLFSREAPASGTYAPPFESRVR